MTNRSRKLDCSRARSQRKRDKRRDKRKAAQSHKRTPTKAERRAKTLQFPVQWGGLFQSNRRGKRAA